MDRDTFSFVVYMIHACAGRWKKLPSDAYRILKDSGCISEYLVPCYDVLHTQGVDYIVDDIQEYLEIRGVKHGRGCS